MPDHVITRYLAMLAPEWHSNAMPDMAPLWWTASAKTERSAIAAHLCLNEDCLTIQAQLAIEPSSPCRAHLWHYLMRLNNEMRLVKFSLDAGGRIYLSAEIPLGAGSVPGFADLKAVMTAIRVYFHEFHREIELVARNQALAEAWQSLQPRVADVDISILRSTVN